MLLKLEIKCALQCSHVRTWWQGFVGGVDSFSSWQRSRDTALPPARCWLSFLKEPDWEDLVMLTVKSWWYTVLSFDCNSSGWGGKWWSVVLQGCRVLLQNYCPIWAGPANSNRPLWAAPLLPWTNGFSSALRRDTLWLLGMFLLHPLAEIALC